jgi:hypothetical protein
MASTGTLKKCVDGSVMEYVFNIKEEPMISDITSSSTKQNATGESTENSMEPLVIKTLISDAPGQITVGWTLNCSVTGVTNFRICLRRVDGLQWTEVYVKFDKRSYTFRALLECVEYEVKVKLVSDSINNETLPQKVLVKGKGGE